MNIKSLFYTLMVDAMPEDRKFDWELYPKLERFIVDAVDAFLSNSAFAKSLSQRMLSQTSTRFVDWIDHIVLPESEVGTEAFTSLGLEEVRTRGDPKGKRVFRHTRSYLFPILLGEDDGKEVALKPESIDRFAQMLGLGTKVTGAPFAPLRKAIVSKRGDHTLSAVERRGYDGFLVEESNDTREYLDVLSAFFQRRRLFDNDEEGMDATERLVKESVSKLDSARVADAFFRAERSYWQNRNRAGQVQKARQDALGLGWGNHDHHTYRSSRENFTRMIDIFEVMGYGCREKYYAGEKSGWGAQILEHPICNIVAFTDVDLNPDETGIDFAHGGFTGGEPRLGTIGLWVGLHGESMLQAGMHHLEARFDFERLQNDLKAFGVDVMPPFSHFEFLKQAFTVGDVWPVERKRLKKLLSDQYITRSQYDAFIKNGALGSHLENLQRSQGFKGFNRSSVTKIIMSTDPRKQHFAGA